MGRKFLMKTDGEIRNCEIHYFCEADNDKIMIEVKGKGEEIINGLITLIKNISLDIADGDKEGALEVVDLFCDIAKKLIREEK